MLDRKGPVCGSSHRQHPKVFTVRRPRTTSGYRMGVPSEIAPDIRGVRARTTCRSASSVRAWTASFGAVPMCCRSVRSRPAPATRGAPSETPAPRCERRPRRVRRPARRPLRRSRECAERQIRRADDRPRRFRGLGSGRAERPSTGAAGARGSKRYRRVRRHPPGGTERESSPLSDDHSDAAPATFSVRASNPAPPPRVVRK
jgi:hypothetical protein